MTHEVAISLQPSYSVAVSLAAAAGALELLPPQRAIAVELQPILRGEPGPSGDKARRHAWASPHSYAATAPAGTADAAAGWAITRITVAADGTTTVAHATAAWTDRATLTYT